MKFSERDSDRPLADYERVPVPSPDLRAAATDAVREVFIEEMSRRLDMIADAAKDLGGEIGIRIRALASADSSSPASPSEPFRVLVRPTPPRGNFLRTGMESEVVDVASRSSGHQTGGERSVSRTGEVLEAGRGRS